MPITLPRRQAIIAALAGLAVPTASYAKSSPERYLALALQTLCDAVNQDKNRTEARVRMDKAFARIDQQIGVAKAFFAGYYGSPLELVVLPEYVLSGFPLGETRLEWKDKAALDMDGPEIERLGEIAQKHGVYLCNNHYETDPNFPELYFQANVILSPAGDLVLRYRRMISLYAPTPYDVWDQYLDIYGAEGVFPVADTPIGRLGTIASEEILYPEIARMHALNGAEVLLHPTAEVASPQLTVKDIAKRARAIENMAYVVSANTGGMSGTPVPQASTDAMSKIVDWHGHVLAEAGYGESMNAVATLDIGDLRSARSNTGMANMLSRLPMDAFEAPYRDAEMAPPNRSADGKMRSRGETIAGQRKTIEALKKSGVLK